MLYPKILIISDPIPQTLNAGSIQLYRLLSEYPHDRILVIGRKQDPGSIILKCSYFTLEFPIIQRLQKTRLVKIINSLEVFGFIKYRLTHQLNKVATEFNPDIVLSIMQLYQYYSTAYFFSITNKIPLALIIHDQPEELQFVFKFCRKRQVKKNASIYKHAFVRMNVSNQMEQLFREIYGIKGDVIYPLASRFIVPRNPNHGLISTSLTRFIIGYAGTSSYGYSHQIYMMIPLFQKLGIKLRFYGKSFPDFLIGFDCIEYGGFEVETDRVWAKIQSECDAVILPYCWEEYGHKKLYETHFPSKLPEYLSLGMPVIIIGPEYATGVQWGLNNKENVIVISDKNPILWEYNLNKIIVNDILRHELSKKALIARDRDFHFGDIQMNFFKLLSNGIIY